MLASLLLTAFRRVMVSELERFLPYVGQLSRFFSVVVRNFCTRCPFGYMLLLSFLLVLPLCMHDFTTWICSSPCMSFICLIVVHWHDTYQCMSLVLDPFSVAVASVQCCLSLHKLFCLAIVLPPYDQNCNLVPVLLNFIGTYLKVS